MAGIYSIEKVKIRCGWKFILLRKLRYDLGLIHWKGQNKAILEIYFIEHENVRYVCGFISLKMLKYIATSQLRIYSIQNAEILYSWGFIPFKMLR